jgi:hypothetical protein
LIRDTEDLEAIARGRVDEVGAANLDGSDGEGGGGAKRDRCGDLGLQEMCKSV